MPPAPAATPTSQQMPIRHRPWRLALAIALVSAAALALQLLLMRWLAIAHWHPFAVVIISLALLGHGASGSALVLWRRAAARHFDWLFPACAIAFALAAVASVLLAARIPFNGLELVWDWRQTPWLSALYLVLSLPFFFAATCFGLAFLRHAGSVPLLYGADLAGAGIGAALALALLHLPTGMALAMACALALLGAALAIRRAHARWLWPLALAAMVAVALPSTRQALAPRVNAFKAQARILLVPGARVLERRHGLHGVVTAVESPQVPLRHVPGLSLGNTQEPPPQLALFTDGDGLSVATRRSGEPGALEYLQRTTSTLPYRLLQRPRVLVLGAGGGADVLQALALGARRVDVVEANPQTMALMRGPLAAFAGDLYRDPRVRVHVADARGFLRAGGATTARYDLVVLAQGSSFAAGAAGVQAVAEDHAATIEALRDAHARLAPGGLLAITRWQKQPPRDWLKLLATAVEALRAEGVRDPGARLAAIRNWDAGTLLLKRGPFSTGEVARLQAFAEAQGFDVVHAPGLQPRAADNFHAGSSAAAQAGARALLSPRREAFIDAYKFAIAPATDDRPYFGNFFKWSTLPELWRLRGQGAAVLLDSGYLLLLAALLQALPLSLLLVLLPLLALPRARDEARIARWRAAAYFLCLGLAFLLVEIACLARLKLLLGQPLPAIGVGLAGFLLFAGLGSLCAQRVLARGTDAIARWQARAVALIAAGLLWHLFCLALALEHGAELPMAARAGLGLLSIAPLAFAMGLPFPLGLSRLAREAPAFVPWAWGINGCASVIAAIAALLLANAVGLLATLLLALALYALAAFAWRAGPASAQPVVA